MNTNEAKQIRIEEYLHSLGYDPVRKQGDSLWYKSPFRNEREPSFKVNTERNLWYDFSAGRGGNIIALEAAFTLKDEYGYKELAEELRKTYASVGVMLGENRLTDLITVLKNKRMIVQENGRKYTFKPDFHY